MHRKILCIMKKNILSLLLFSLCVLNAQAQSYDNYRSLLRNQNVKISDTNLPIIFIDVNGKMILRDNYILGHMKVIHNGNGQYNYGDTIAHPGQRIDYEGPIAIKYRGNSSFSNSDKKPFQLRTLKSDLLPDDGGEKLKVEILGMGKDNKWMFIAPWADKVMFRDILSFDLARPWMDYSPSVKLCEVILDGTYYGVYGFGERVSKGKHRLNLHDPGADGGDLTGDYHVEIDRSDDPYYTSKHHPWRNLDGDEEWNKTIKYQYKDPENEEWADFPGAKEALHQEIDKMENSFLADNWQDPATGYQRYIDMTSFIDYMLSTEVANNIDGYRLSTNLYKYSETRADNEGIDPRWKMALWDFNIAWGNANYYNGQRTDSWHYTFNQRESGDGEHLPFYWYRMLKDKNFILALKARWKQYREGNYSDTNIMHTVDSLAMTLRIRGAADRNQQAWQIIGRSVWPNPYNGNTFDEELSYLKQWIRKRLAFMDEAIENMQLPDDPKPAVPKNTVPVAVKAGLNADVIVEQLPAQEHANLGIDGGNQHRAFYSTAIRQDGGLPADHTITSVAQGVKYELADYAGNNVVALRSEGESATAEFEPFATSDLYILATSGNGESSVQTVINYTDGTHSTPVTLTIRDWSLRNPDGSEALAGIGNISLSTGSLNSDECHDALYDLHLTVDETKELQSVTFTSTNNSLPTIFAFARQMMPEHNYEPVDVESGWNADVIAETQDVSASVNQTVDDNYVFYAQSAHQNGGLPDSRAIESAATGADYLLSAYDGNNALSLRNQGARGKLTFKELFNTPELMLLGTSANGTSTISVTITYEDGTTEQASPIFINDWYVTDPTGEEAVVNLGRVSQRSGFSWRFSEDLSFALFDIAITADEHKNIRDITVLSNGSSIPTILAVSKKKTDVEPDPINGIFQRSTSSLKGQSSILYNLQGQRVDESYKGITIVKGKKVKR